MKRTRAGNESSGSSVRLEYERANRIRTEEELRRSEASLAEAQRIAHLGNWDWNITDDELHWSDEIYRIFGLDSRSFGATYEAFLDSVHPDDRKSVQDAVDKAMEDKEPYSIDHRIVLPDGTKRIVHEQAEVFLDDAGKAIRMVGTVQDITDRKLAEQGVVKRQKALEAVYRIATTTGATMETVCDRVVEIEALVRDVDASSITSMVDDVDVILDGTGKRLEIDRVFFFPGYLY
ncbi:PAS domain-containing protein, partial [Planctomycetota bacterium]